jgi:hypothetical protein
MNSLNNCFRLTTALMRILEPNYHSSESGRLRFKETSSLIRISHQRSASSTLPPLVTFSGAWLAVLILPAKPATNGVERGQPARYILAFDRFTIASGDPTSGPGLGCPRRRIESRPLNRFLPPSNPNGCLWTGISTTYLGYSSLSHSRSP